MSSAAVHLSAVVEGTIGSHTVVGAHAYVGPLVVVGANCVIGPGACLGQSGFGYTRRPDGQWDTKPQQYGVVVGDNVSIGANTCVDRGSYRPTVIGTGTKVDNLVHIAHNVEVGEHCLIVAGAMLAGSVEVGGGVYIAPGAQIREHTTIGDGAFVALGAVVTKDVAAGQAVRGVPATPFHLDPARSPLQPPGSHVAS